MLQIGQAIREGIELSIINKITKIDLWFLERINEIIAVEEKIKKKSLPKSREELLYIKSMGFTDSRLSELSSLPEEKVFEFRKSKQINADVLTETSLILGLGETDQEIEKAMDDLIAHKVDILTLGQYLRPTLNHLPVERWVTPKEFNKYREIGLKRGVLEVVSGPMVRSSYRAEQALQKNNAGLEMSGI